MKKLFGIVSVVVVGLFLPAQGLLAQDQPARAAESTGSQSAAKATTKTPDRAAAYYHFTLAHMYEEQVATYGRSELANKAIEEYRARH